MSGRRFAWEFRRQGPTEVVCLSGPLDESSPLDDLAPLIEHPVCLDVSQVTGITSMGIRGWLSFIREISKRGTHRIRACPPFFVTQMNMIPNFTGAADVESIMVPFFCDTCDAERLVLFPTLTLAAEADVPHAACQQCSEQMVFDDVASRYLAFLRDPELRHAREPQPAAEADPASRERAAATVLFPEVDTVLRQACDRGAPVTLSLSDLPRVLSGHLTELGDDVLRVSLHSLAGLAAADEIRLGQHCVVTFHHGGRPAFFLTTIVDLVWQSQSEKRPAMELALPRQIAAAEVRRALRVPIPEDSGVHVTLTTDAHATYTPTLRNLSLSGMLIAFAATTDPRFDIYDRVEVAIGFGGQQARLRGTICRKETSDRGVYYGVSFPEFSGQSALAPSDGLRQVVEHFEARWIDTIAAAEENA